MTTRIESAWMRISVWFSFPRWASATAAEAKPSNRPVVVGEIMSIVPSGGAAFPRVDTTTNLRSKPGQHSAS